MNLYLYAAMKAPDQPRAQRGWRPVAVLLALLVVQGCAATTTFIPYTGKMNPLIGDLESGKTIDTNKCLVEECLSQDAILYLMERGRIAQIMGNPGDSMKDFANSMAAIRMSNEKALISASDITAQMAAIAVNDNAIPYKGDGYERVMLYHYQAMNYLFSQNVEGAGIEVRRANAEQEEALKRHEKEIEKARQEADKNHVKVQNERQVTAQFARMNEVAGNVKNSFQNAYTFYLSGLVYELLKQPNDAYIDYRKALEIFPDNSYLRQDVDRLASTLGMSDDPEIPGRRANGVGEKGAEGGISAREKKAGMITGNDPDTAHKTGELILFFEDGFVPQKQEVKITLPLPNVGLVALSFPIYSARWTKYPPVTVSEGEMKLGTMEPICHVKALAVKSLMEKVPSMVIRQAIRAVAKGASAKQAKEKYGLMGELGSSLYNFASENADLRSWTTLPETVQVMRLSLPAGAHNLNLRQADRRVPATIKFAINEGGKTVVRVIRAGNRAYVESRSF